jgi:hypothetical protein
LPELALTENKNSGAQLLRVLWLAGLPTRDHRR